MLDKLKKQQLEFVRRSSAYEAMRRDVDITDGHAFVFASRDTLLSHLLGILAAASVSCDDVCLTCKSCAKIFGGNSLDVTDLGDGKVMTEDIERVLDGCGYSPYELPYKFYILNFSDRNDAAQNKFLKTLEEPPPYAKFIVITSSLATLLPTVKSRCTLFEPTLIESELRGLEDSMNPNSGYASYAARGNLTEFYGLLSGSSVDNLLAAINIARGIGKSEDMVRLLKYLPVTGTNARQKLVSVLGYLEIVYGDLVKSHGGLPVETHGIYDIISLKQRITQSGLPQALTAIRRAVRRSEGGNLTSVADELIIKLTEVNYNSRSN